MPDRSGGNRQDNRQRGNAAQLLEKYKALARDSQLAGDRVQTEYYLQFADHYFRVLEDGRSRFEDQNQRRRRDEEDDDSGEGGVSADAETGDDDDIDDEPRAAPRRDRAPQRDRVEQDQRPQRAEQDQRPQRAEQAQRPPRADRAERSDRSERPERPRRDRPVIDQADGDERIALGVLPPAINVTSDDGAAEAPRPRRRVRKPRDEDEDIAPAA